jgi:hypothetical protein
MSRHSRPRTGPAVAAALLLLMLGARITLAQAPAIHPKASSPSGTIASPEDIREIRGPKPIESPWVIPLMVIAGLLVAAGGCAAWRWDRRRPHGVAKLPSQIALERLAQARAFMHPSGGREFSIEVSSIVRDYIESRFRVMAAHRTTDEFLHDLLEPAESSLRAHRALLAEFLQSCDLAKFGGWDVPQPSMQAMLQGAQRFVIESAEPQAAAISFAKSAPGARRGSRESYDSIPTT